MLLAYVNILWILFTIIGLGIFGIAPATIAVFAVTRKWVTHGTDIAIFQTFWDSYRSEFIKGQLIGILLISIGTIFYADFKFFSMRTGFASNILFFCIIGFLVLFISAVLFLIPTYVHYKMKFTEYLKNSFIIGISHPIHVASMFGGIIIILAMIYFFQAFIFFFLVSANAYWLTWVAHKAFEKVEIMQGNREAI